MIRPAFKHLPLGYTVLSDHAYAAPLYIPHHFIKLTQAVSPPSFFLLPSAIFFKKMDDLFAPPSAAEIAARVGLHDAELVMALASTPGGSELEALDETVSSLTSIVSE